MSASGINLVGGGVYKLYGTPDGDAWFTGKVVRYSSRGPTHMVVNFCHGLIPHQHHSDQWMHPCNIYSLPHRVKFDNGEVLKMQLGNLEKIMVVDPALDKDKEDSSSGDEAEPYGNVSMDHGSEKETDAMEEKEDKKEKERQEVPLVCVCRGGRGGNTAHIP